MKATQLITILFSLFIYSSCNVAGLVGVEAPIGVTGLWVVDLFDGNTYKISGTETIDPYMPISIQY